MKIAIIGPGAMGCLFAVYLRKGGLDVTLVDHDQKRAELLQNRGIQIQGVRGKHHVHVPVSGPTEWRQPADLVMICVKAFSTQRALEQHFSLIGPKTLVFSMQNGIGNIEIIADMVCPDNILAGTTTIGSNLRQPGQVHHAGDGETYIGELTTSARKRTYQIAKKLNKFSLQIKVSDDVRKLIWKKLVINVGINALTAILRVQNGVLAEHASCQSIMQEAVAEAVQIAKTQHIDLGLQTMLEQVMQVAKRTGQNRSSMLADMLAGKKTEIDAINGAICKMGPSPCNQMLTHLIHALEATTEKRLS